MVVAIAPVTVFDVAGWALFTIAMWVWHLTNPDRDV